jgi:hypothetical protein
MADLDPETRERIQALLRELRRWHPGVPEATLEELAERFELPDLVVRRIADSDGFDLHPAGVPEAMDPDVTTQPIDIDLEE